MQSCTFDLTYPECNAHNLPVFLTGGFKTRPTWQCQVGVIHHAMEKKNRKRHKTWARCTTSIMSWKLEHRIIMHSFSHFTKTTQRPFSHRPNLWAYQKARQETGGKICTGDHLKVPRQTLRHLGGTFKFGTLWRRQCKSEEWMNGWQLDQWFFSRWIWRVSVQIRC